MRGNYTEKHEADGATQSVALSDEAVDSGYRFA